MSYCGDPVTTPHELDFAVLSDIGYSVRPASVRNTPETYVYGAWGDWAAWGVGVDRLLAGTRDHHSRERRCIRVGHHRDAVGNPRSDWHGVLGGYPRQRSGGSTGWHPEGSEFVLPAGPLGTSCRPHGQREGSVGNQDESHGPAYVCRVSCKSQNDRSCNAALSVAA